MAGGRVAGAILLSAGLVMIVVGLIGAITGSFLVCAPGSCGTGGGTQTQIGNLVGYVTNQTSGAGVQGATVRLLVSGIIKYSALTTSDGYFKFGGIVAAGYSVQILANGYKEFDGSAGVPPGSTGTLNVQLAPLGAYGSGTSQGCSDPLGGCSVPPPPPGVSPPPPPTQNTTQNQTQNTTRQPTTPSELSVLVVVIGAVLVIVAAAVWKA